MFGTDGRAFHRPLAISVAGLLLAGVGLAVLALVLAVAHRETGQAPAYILVAIALTGVAVMVLRGTRWVIRVIIVVLAGQLAAIAGTAWELSHGIDARKASQLRQLGFDPTAGVVINLIYSSIGFALFCWFATRWLAARRRRHASSRAAMIAAEAADGTSVRAFDEGHGPAVLILHGGIDDGSSWRRVAVRLAPRFRVLRLHRRQYRPDLKTGSACTMAEEVEHVTALVRAIGQPMVIVGHSSGAVVALEELVATPTAFSGAVLYEPPCVIGPPLGGVALARAQAAIAAGKSGTALAIFLRDIVRAPAWAARLSKLVVALSPRIRRMARHQIDDCAAIDQLGNRLDTYTKITVSIVLLGGDRSPPHLGERLDALEGVLPNTERVVLQGQGHAANALAPGRVADVIAGFAARVLRP